MPGYFDAHDLHAQAQSQVGHAMSACELRSQDFALDAPVAKPAGHQYAADSLEHLEPFIFFQIAMVISGVVIIPVAQEVKKTMIELQKANGIIGIIFLYLGAIGFLLTGLIPDDTLPIKKLHEITAGLGFGGVLFAAFFLFWPSLKGINSIVDKRILISITLLWWIPLIIFIYAYGWAELVIKEQYNLGWYSIEWEEAGVSPFYSFAVWERILYVIMFIYLWLLPKSIKEY
jgi:hypothetical protein